MVTSNILAWAGGQMGRWADPLYLPISQIKQSLKDNQETTVRFDSSYGHVPCS